MKKRCWLLLLGAVGCADVLGFERASLDPIKGSASATLDSGAEPAEVGAQDAGTPLATLDCATFCGVVNDACVQSESESYAVYDSSFTCLQQCAGYALGTAGDDRGDSLACRMTHALIARDFPGERANACPAAGPGGDGVCGTNCAGYCRLMLTHCESFTSEEQCLEACNGVPDLGGFDVSINTGDSVQCRLYHLGAALASPTFHCPHAAGQSPCANE